jgi:hypothetical protein
MLQEVVLDHGVSGKHLRRLEEDSGVKFTFQWFPTAPYDDSADDDNDSSYRRCGSGAYAINDDQGGAYCGTYGHVKDFVNFDDDGTYHIGDGCQTIEPVGAQTFSDVNFFMTKDDSQTSTFEAPDIDGNKAEFYFVIKMYKNTYCTGAGVEFYANDQSRSPTDLDAHTPVDNDFGNGFKSYYMYAKPVADSGIAIPENPGIGIKMMAFPYENNFPLDQTPCTPPTADSDPRYCANEEAGSKFVWVPSPPQITENWPGLDCVSSFDRKVCFDESKQSQAWFGMTKDVDPNGIWSQVDFAGCSAVKSDYGNWINDPNGYCYQSTLQSLTTSYPLSSFLYNVYTIQDGFCADSQQTSDWANEYDFCQMDKYDNLCIEARFYDCTNRDDCDDGGLLPIKDGQGTRYFFTSTALKDFCPGGSSEDGTSVNVRDMLMVGDDGNIAGNVWEYLQMEEWAPIPATGYVAGLTRCNNDVQNSYELI